LDEALSNLEEVAVRLIWCEVNIESERAVAFDLLPRWNDLEWVVHKLSSCLVEDWEQGPINHHWKAELVLQCELSGFTYSAVVCEAKVDLI